MSSWSQGYGHSSLSCAKALDVLKEWEGISEVTEQLKILLEEEQGVLGFNEKLSFALCLYFCVFLYIV